MHKTEDIAASVEYWQQVKALSEMVISSLKVAQVSGSLGQIEHSHGLSSLKILLSEQSEMIVVDSALFKELLQLVLNLPEFSSKLTTVDVDFTTTPAGETLIRLKPGDFLLRLSAALRACG